MALVYQYRKPRSSCGQQPMFCEQGPEMCDSIATNPAEFKFYILRNPVHQFSQKSAIFSKCHINTIRAEYVTTGVDHDEGGWPHDVNTNDPEAVQRYKRRMEKEDAYIHCIMNSSPGIEHYLNQNNAIDMYRTYYEELTPLPPIEKISIRTINVYRDPCKGPKRPISSISWQSEHGSTFVVSHADVDFNRTPKGSVDCYIWEMEYPKAPLLVLEPPCTVLDLQFNPKDNPIIIGGLINGQTCYWDMRTGGIPIACSPPHNAHRDLVKNVLTINSKSGTEFFSASPDGVVKWWDLRKYDDPTDLLIMDPANNSFDIPSMVKAMGVSVLEFENTMPTRFMTGTENGYVLIGNRKGKSPLDKIPGRYVVHNGPVLALERNPAFLKNFLTVGDWTVRISSEDCKESAVIWSPPMRYKPTSATWSPTKFSLMAVAHINGVLALWDIIRKQYEPVLTMQVCEEPLTKLRFHEHGTYLACGSKIGNIYMIEMSQSLVQSASNDKVLLTQIFERESKRERILEARLREIRLKQRQDAEMEKVPSATEIDPSVGDADLYEATVEFNTIVKKELTMM